MIHEHGAYMYMYMVCLLRFYYAMVGEAPEAYVNRPVCVGVSD